MEAAMILSTKHLFPDWNERLLEESAYEASQPQVRLLQDEGRNAVWETCGWLGCESRGVPGVACRLLERYLYAVLHDHSDGEFEHVFRQNLQRQLPLLIASCVTLASKMNNSAAPVAARLVHVVFLCKKISCTLDDIKENEWKVYSKLGFRLPLWTGVETGELLAVKIGIPVELLQTIALLVDIAEYRRHVINKKVRWVANVPPSSTIGGILSLHLTAGAVAAIAKFFDYNGPDIVPRLAKITKAPKSFIKCVRDAICAEIFAEIPKHTEQSLELK